MHNIMPRTASKYVNWLYINERSVNKWLRSLSLTVKYGTNTKLWIIIQMSVISYIQCCPRGKSLSSRTNLQVLALSSARTSSPYPWTKVLGLQSPQKLLIEFSILCKQSVIYDHLKVHKFDYCYHARGYGEEWLTDIRVADISKPFFTVSQCCYPWAPIYKSLDSSLKSLTALRHLLFSTSSSSSYKKMWSPDDRHHIRLSLQFQDCIHLLRLFDLDIWPLNLPLHCCIVWD